MEICKSLCSRPLVRFVAGMSFVGGMATSPVLIFWSMMTLFSFRLSSRESHFRSSTMAVTLSVVLKLPETYLAALL